jgi:hypothetical protein
MSTLEFSEARPQAAVALLALAAAAVLTLAQPSQALPPICTANPHLCAVKTYIEVFPNQEVRALENARAVSAPSSLSLRDYIEGNISQPTYRFTGLRWKHWGEASASAFGLMRYCQHYSRALPGAHSFCRVAHVHLIADQFEPCPDFNLYSRVRVLGTRYVHMLRVADQSCGAA